jgi:nitrogen fixation NifU-like protein
MGAWDDIYREEILEHAQHPRHHGVIEHPDLSYEDANPLCGDRIRMDFVVRDNRVQDVRFSGEGCAISQAAASMLCERVVGHTLEEIRAVNREDVLEMLGIELGPVRLKCALLGLKTLKAGLYGLGTTADDDEEESP